MSFNQPTALLVSCIHARSVVVSVHRARRLDLTSLCGYATQTSLGATSTKRRRAVTVVNDDGRVKWGDLSLGEKFARTTQQTFNFGIILAGLVLTVGLSIQQFSHHLLTGLGRSWIRAIL